jgi:SAM-dependent methyltransferase
MSSSDSIESRHRRFSEQAAWTAGLRHRLLAQLPADGEARFLEVGAGTGAIVVEIAAGRPSGRVLAVDIDLASCRFGAGLVPRAGWCCGDAHRLPFESSSLDATLFHFVLLWLDDPVEALGEALRVTRSGGWIAALAEPDHASRIDFPDVLARLGARQTDALAGQGADVRLGRKLRGLFSAAGLVDVEAGVLGGEWGPSSAPGASTEWATLRADLAPTVSAADLDALERFDLDSWERGERVLFVPTFFAIGRVS